MDAQKFDTLMYALTKHAASDSFVGFLKNWGLTLEDYKEIKGYLSEKYGIKPYL